MQVRTLPVVKPDNLFAIGYCFGGGGVLELFRAWPNSGAGLLGEQLPPSNVHMCTGPCCCAYSLSQPAWHSC